MIGVAGEEVIKCGEKNVMKLSHFGEYVDFIFALGNRERVMKVFP